MNQARSGGQRADTMVWVDGVPAAAVCALDRGLHYGDGLFETIACLGGTPRFLPWHLERLALGCERLGMAAPDLALTEREIRQAARHLGRAIVKLIVTRGTATGRGYAASGDEVSRRILLGYAWPPEADPAARDGVHVRTLTQPLGENPLLAGIKHCNRLEQVLAQKQLRAASAAGPQPVEGILFSASGKLVSGIQSNLFIVRQGALLTPRLDACGVAGIMRRAVMSAAQEVGLGVQQLPLGAADLYSAEELFLTNARIGIWPVRTLDGREIGPGAVTRRMQQVLAPRLEAPASA